MRMIEHGNGIGFTFKKANRPSELFVIRVKADIRANHLDSYLTLNV